MSGWLLILALLVLGGILSTLGDRLGSKVGKARLSLFNLRPRKTAVVITALTGSLISAISLGLMLLVSERLRVGLFELDQLQERLRDGRQALARSQADLQRSKSDLQQNREELKTNQRELQRSRIERNRALQGRQAAIASEQKVTYALARAQQRVGDLRRELQPLQNQRRQLEAQRDRLTQDVKGRDAEIQRTEKELAGVRARIDAGAKELKELEGKVIALRRGDVLIASGQPLAMGRIRLGRQENPRQSIDALLQEANAAAFRLLLPGQKPDRQILLVPRSDIERLDQALRKPGVWVIVIRSAANILRGEQRVLAFPDLRPNRGVVRRGEVLARTVLDGDLRSPEEVRSRLNLLLAAAYTQAQRQGTLVDGLQVDGAKFNRLGLDLSQRPEGMRATLEAVAMANADTPDPIAVELRWIP
ncbi:MAG: hypothetical protein RLZZ609_2145 [Cyanobacteriota bacterium]